KHCSTISTIRSQRFCTCALCLRHRRWPPMPSLSKHLLTPGAWIGRGSFLDKGQSLGTTIECTFDVTSEQVGTHIKGELTLRDGAGRHAFAVWITPNDTGT